MKWAQNSESKMNLIKAILRRVKSRLQRLRWVHMIIFLVILLAALQILHVTLLSRLEVRNTRLKRASSLRKLQQDTVRLYYTIKQTVETNQVLDSSGQYKIINNVLGAKNSQKDTNGASDVTLVSQCSLNHMHHIAHLSKRWPGPVSVTVFAAAEDVTLTVEMVLQLYYCVPSMRYNVTVHILLPFTNLDIVLPTRPTAGDIFSCKKGNTKHKQMHNYDLEGVPYPNNLLRNVALRNSHTGYVFVVDIDMLPNADLYQDFTNYLWTDQGRSSNRYVYVVPAFEIQPNIPLPQNKEQLLMLWKQNKLRPFYQELCWKCQQPTDYDAWRRLSIIEGVGMGYEVAWVDPWEPFFIAPRESPLYDERFRQYGFNRISQVCEVHIAGYKFSILNSAFLVHKGYKAPDSFHSTKEQEQEQNRLLFRQFKEELKSKYPESNRRCY